MKIEQATASTIKDLWGKVEPKVKRLTSSGNR
jgi:hypothetical protein